MKAVGSQLVKASQSSKSDDVVVTEVTDEVRDQRASCRSAAKDLFKHLKEVLDKADVSTADHPPGASDGSLFGAPSPPSVVPSVPSNGGDVAGCTPPAVRENAHPMEHSAATATDAGMPSAAESVPVPALSLNREAQPAGTEPPKLTLPKDVQRGPGSGELATFASADSASAAALVNSKEGASNGVAGSKEASSAPGLDPLLPITRRVPLRSSASAGKHSTGSAPASRSPGESPPAARGKQLLGLLLPRRQEATLTGAVASESPPGRTASPRAPASPRLLLSPRPLASPGTLPLSHAQPQGGGQAGNIHASDQPRARSSVLFPRDGKARPGGAHPLKAIGGSVYDAITEDTGLHVYEPMTPSRSVLRSALTRRGGRRVAFGVDKTWILPPLSPASSPTLEPDEVVMDLGDDYGGGDDEDGSGDDDGGSGDVGLALKVRNKDVESEAKHFHARHVSYDSDAVDALLTLTLRRAFEYFANNPELLSDPTPADLGAVMCNICGAIDEAQTRQD